MLIIIPKKVDIMALIIGTYDNFDAEVLQSETSVLVYFWAPWCRHCVAFSPTMDEVAAELDGRVNVVKIDVQAFPKLAKGFTSIPTVQIFRGGVSVFSASGTQPKQMILAVANV